MSKSITMSIILTLAMIGTAYSYWPVSLEENLSISAEPDTLESYPQAIPFSDGRIFTAFKKTGIGIVYQIIDCYGDFQFDIPQPMVPANIGEYSYPLYTNLIPDGYGGCIAAWTMSYLPSGDGVYAQRIDSLGNRLWGDAGVRVFPVDETDFDICSDGNGGFYMAMTYNPNTQIMDLVLQKITSDGQLVWGDSGIVVISNQYAQRYPKITSDGYGGSFVVWEDNRPPYTSYNAALFAQRFDSDGNAQWNEDLFICEEPWAQWCEIISDGEGGIIVQSNPGPSDYNRHWRIDGEGNILWERDHLSW